jgi:hypothetical protein
MSKIEIKIEILNIEKWDVDWNNESEKTEQLDKLKFEIKQAISRDMGIEWTSVNIDKIELNKQP